jgi:hypothetical protein
MRCSGCGGRWGTAGSFELLELLELGLEFVEDIGHGAGLLGEGGGSEGADHVAQCECGCACLRTKN